MVMVITIYGAVIVALIAFYAGYRTGKAVEFRKMQDMEEPAFSLTDEKKRQKYLEFFKAFDALMSEENDAEIEDEADLPLDECEHYCKDDISDFIRASVDDEMALYDDVFGDDDTIVDINSGTTYNDNKYGE